MRARHELHKLRAGGRLYNIGGDKDQGTNSNTYNYDQRQVNTFDTTNYDLSNHSVSTTNNTTNSTTNADFSDRSVNTSTSTTNADFSDRSISNVWTDSSNRSVTTSTTNADFSDRSTTSNSTWTDNSNRSTNNTTVYNTDGGAVSGALALASGAVNTVAGQLAAALGFAGQVATGQNATVVNAYDFGDNIFHSALDAVNQNDARALDAFERASTIQADALALTKNQTAAALAQVQNAYADAKGTTEAQQKIMLGVLVVAAVAVIAPRLGK
jgi:hypothetical protein